MPQGPMGRWTRVVTDNRETCLSSERLYEGKMIRVRKDTVQLPNGHQSCREVVEHPGAVAVLAVTQDDRVLLVRQFRYPVGLPLRELPAGKLEPGEDPGLAAIRELREETGYTALNWRKLSTFYTAPGFSDEVMHLYLATDLIEGESDPDDDEFVECESISRDEIVKGLESGLFEDAKTLVGLLLFLRA